MAGECVQERLTVLPHGTPRHALTRACWVATAHDGQVCARSDLLRLAQECPPADLNLIVLWEGSCQDAERGLREAIADLEAPVLSGDVARFLLYAVHSGHASHTTSQIEALRRVSEADPVERPEAELQYVKNQCQDTSNPFVGRIFINIDG